MADQASVIYRIYSSYFHNMGFAYQPLFGKMTGLEQRQKSSQTTMKIFLLCCARFIFASAAGEQNANKRKLNIPVGLEKTNILLIQPLLPSGISWTVDSPPPPPLWNFQSLPWGRYGYFLEPPNLTYAEILVLCGQSGLTSST